MYAAKISDSSFSWRRTKATGTPVRKLTCCSYRSRKARSEKLGNVSERIHRSTERTIGTRGYTVIRTFDTVSGSISKSALNSGSRSFIYSLSRFFTTPFVQSEAATGKPTRLSRNTVSISAKSRRTRSPIIGVNPSASVVISRDSIAASHGVRSTFT